MNFARLVVAGSEPVNDRVGSEATVLLKTAPFDDVVGFMRKGPTARLHRGRIQIDRLLAEPDVDPTPLVSGKMNEPISSQTLEKRLKSPSGTSLWSLNERLFLRAVLVYFDTICSPAKAASQVVRNATMTSERTTKSRMVRLIHSSRMTDSMTLSILQPLEDSLSPPASNIWPGGEEIIDIKKRNLFDRLILRFSVRE